MSQRGRSAHKRPSPAKSPHKRAHIWYKTADVDGPSLAVNHLETNISGE